MAIGSFGRNSPFQSGSRSSRVGFTKSVSGGNGIAGNEAFTRAESFTDAETATPAGASQHSVRFKAAVQTPSLYGSRGVKSRRPVNSDQQR